MKIGILTYYNVHNHGALLQAKALQEILLSMGHEVSFLTFDRDYRYLKEGSSKKYAFALSGIPYYASLLWQRGIPNVLYNLSKKKILHNFRSTRLRMGTSYSDFSGDAVIIGSDEVFSLEVGRNDFFYGHGLTADRIISYAGSFGPTTLEDIRAKNAEALIRTGAEKFCALGVRDENSERILQHLCGKPVSLVCDPVLLYGYAEEQSKFVPAEKEYIAIYAYDKSMNDPDEVEKIKVFAKRKNKKLLSLGYHHPWCHKSISATPEELLGWFKNASLVITDTFHGSVISIICNTPFVTMLRGNQNKLQFLLQQHGLENRLLPDFAQLEAVSSRLLDFTAVNAIVAQNRASSLRFLKDALESQL